MLTDRELQQLRNDGRDDVADEVERLRFELSRAADGIERGIVAADSRVAAERERCAAEVRKIVEQVLALDDDDPQPDLSCVDWLRAAQRAIDGPNVANNRIPTAPQD